MRRQRATGRVYPAWRVVAAARVIAVSDRVQRVRLEQSRLGDAAMSADSLCYCACVLRSLVVRSPVFDR